MLPDIFGTGDMDLKELLNSEDRDLISHIKAILGPFILRRLKTDVMQQLVPKTQRVSVNCYISVIYFIYILKYSFNTRPL